MSEQERPDGCVTNFDHGSERFTIWKYGQRFELSSPSIGPHEWTYNMLFQSLAKEVHRLGCEVGRLRRVEIEGEREVRRLASLNEGQRGQIVEASTKASLAMQERDRLAERVRFLEERAANPHFDRIGADRLADEVAALVTRRMLDARSPVADALLDYRGTPRTERSDRIAELENAKDRLAEEDRALRLEDGEIFRALKARIADLEGEVRQLRCGHLGRTCDVLEDANAKLAARVGELEGAQITAEEGQEIITELTAAFAVLFGESLTPCAGGCPGHLGSKASAAAREALDRWTAMQTELDKAALERQLLAALLPIITREQRLEGEGVADTTARLFAEREEAIQAYNEALALLRELYAKLDAARFSK